MERVEGQAQVPENGAWEAAPLRSKPQIQREADMMGSGRDRNLLALDDALKDLEKFDARKARIVELRFFGGLSVDETAAVVGVAPITIMREFEKARAWLYKAVTNDK